MSHHKADRSRFPLLPIILLLTATQFFSCSTSIYKYFYNSLDAFMVRSINSYFELNSDQLDFVQKRLKTFQQWHRQNELKHYIIMLKKLQRGVEQGLTKKELAGMSREVRNKFRTYYGRLTDDTVQFLSSVEDRQILHLEKKLNSDMDKLRQKNARPLGAKRAERSESLLKGLEFLYGDLSEKQKRKILIKASKIKDTFRIQAARRQKANEEFITLLRENRKEKFFKSKFKAWVAKIETSRPRQYRDIMERNNSTYREIFLFVNNHLATREQKKHAVDKIDDVIQVISELRQGL